MAYPTLATASGTRLMVSTTLPSTHDEAGFQTVKAGATVIGFITEPGGFPRAVREFNQTDLLNGTRYYTPTVENMETVTPTFIFQEDDAGQVILDTNADGETLLTFIYDLPGTRNVGCVGYATGYAPNITGPNDPVTGTINIQPVFNDAGIGAIRFDDAP